jgi:hypothetical protein
MAGEAGSGTALTATPKNDVSIRSSSAVQLVVAGLEARNHISRRGQFETKTIVRTHVRTAAEQYHATVKATGAVMADQHHRRP